MPPTGERTSKRTAGPMRAPASTLLLVSTLLLTLGLVSCGRKSTQTGSSTTTQDRISKQETQAGTDTPVASTAEADRTAALDSASTDTSPRGRPDSTPTDRLAYIGYYGGPDGAQALIEDMVLRLQTFKKVGQDAFGFTVESIDAQRVVLEREGVELTLEFSGKKPALPTVSGINPEKYPPIVIHAEGSNGDRRVPAPPPPESQVIQPVRAEQLPAVVQTQLQERLRQKSGDRR